MEDIKVLTKELEMIRVENLHIRYVPMAHLERFYFGEEMMLLKNSPHVELLNTYIKSGYDWDILMNTRYAVERRSRRVDFNQSKWSEKFIMKHIIDRVKIYESMRDRGFVSKKSDKPIMVLMRPFWETRYGVKKDGVVGPEIWNGAGRCAAAYVLGRNHVKGKWVADGYPGIKVCKKIEDKFK